MRNCSCVGVLVHNLYLSHLNHCQVTLPTRPPVLLLPAGSLLNGGHVVSSGCVCLSRSWCRSCVSRPEGWQSAANRSSIWKAENNSCHTCEPYTTGESENLCNFLKGASALPVFDLRSLCLHLYLLRLVKGIKIMKGEGGIPQPNTC